MIFNSVVSRLLVYYWEKWKGVARKQTNISNDLKNSSSSSSSSGSSSSIIMEKRVNSTVQSMKSRVSTTERYCFHFALFYLQFINIIDFLLGGLFLIFALYLMSALGSHYLEIQVAWLGLICFVLGILLLLTTICSFCAISSTNCRIMATPTDFLAFIIVLVDFSTGIAAIQLQSVVLSYLDNHGNEIGLSSSNIEALKGWYVVVVISLFVSCILEIVRIWLNRGFYYTSRKLDVEYDTLLTEEEREWEEKMQIAQQTTQEKYRKLKQHYHQKYNKPLRPEQETLNDL